MNQINNVPTKREITTQLVQNVIAQQNAICNGKEKNAIGVINQQNQQQDSLYISNEAQMLFQQMERMREENEDSAEMAEKQAKCMLIAMRIAAGDEVPRSDIKFLIKYNMGLYTKAMEMRIPKPEPEEHDTVLDEDEKKEMEDVNMEAGFVGAPDVSEVIASGKEG